MAFHTYNTSGFALDDVSKTLVYGIHGAGKTTQAANYKARFGKGLIISGEGGLRSVANKSIEYLPFNNWSDNHDPANGVLSFTGICGMINSPEFKAENYKWVMIDSLTEMSDRLYEHLQAHPELWISAKTGKANPLDMWGKYAEAMMKALKWVRDLPMHVCVSAMCKEELDDQEKKVYWPMVKGSGVGRQIPGIFDFVFGLLKSTDITDPKAPKIIRHIVTDEIHGWKGKVRDPMGLIKPIESDCNGDITELLTRLSGSGTKKATSPTPSTATK